MAICNSPWLSEDEVFFHRMESFHRERVELFAARQSPLSIYDGGILVCHLIPKSTVMATARLDFAKLIEHSKEIPPLGGSTGQYRCNVDGLLNIRGSEAIRAYSQVFRDGRLEAVMPDITFPFDRQDKNSRLGLCDSVCDKAVFNSVAAYFKFCGAVGLTPPLRMFSALIDCKGVHIYTDWGFRDLSEHSFDRSPLYLPDFEITSFEGPVHTLLRPWCDFVWQAGGLEKSWNFDNKGNWRDRRR